MPLRTFTSCLIALPLLMSCVGDDDGDAGDSYDTVRIYATREHAAVIEE